jgi:hypothetical protein
MTARIGYLPLDGCGGEGLVWARCRRGETEKPVAQHLKMPMAGLESEPAIFFGEANVGLGRRAEVGSEHSPAKHAHRLHSSLVARRFAAGMSR